jgi:SAM-dependent methyltransferase
MHEDVFDLSQGWNSFAAEALYGYMPGGIPAGELEFYDRRIRANGGAALDRACGTGRHLFPLLARGLEVHGADISSDVLRFAGKEAVAQKVHPTPWSESVDLFEQTLLSKRRYDLYVNGKCIRSEVHAHLMRWYFHYEMLMMLERAGFEDITTYADDTDLPATKDSKTVVYGARRQL